MNMSGMGSWLGMGQCADASSPYYGATQTDCDGNPTAYIPPAGTVNTPSTVVPPTAAQAANPTGATTTMNTTTLAMIVGGMLLVVVLVSKAK